MGILTDSATPRSPTVEAAEWFVILQSQDLSQEDQEAFADWLLRSPVHVGEFLKLTALHGDLERLPRINHAELTGLFAEAAESASSVVPLPDLERVSEIGLEELEEGEGPLPHSGQSGRSRQASGGSKRSAGGRLRRWLFPANSEWLWSAAAAVIGALLLTFFLKDPLHWFDGIERYQTAVGEQRSVTLADGSRVQLNVLSNLSARVNEDVRDLQLTEGEAIFTVAKDAARPFRVHTPQVVIEAKGTQFNVRVRKDGTTVALLEGRVDVTPVKSSSRGASGAAVALEPGQQLTVTMLLGEEPPRPVPQAVDPNSVTAWTERRLVFENTRLEDVVNEFNRYSRQPLVIEDPELREIRITAVFDSNDVRTFTSSLAAAGGLRITHRADGSWLIEPR